MFRSIGHEVRAMAVAFLLAGLVTGCGEPVPDERDAAMTSQSIQEVLAAHNDSLLALPQVVGTAVGRCGHALCIRVFVTDPSDAVRDAIPDSLEGYPVRVEVSEEFRAR
jgi:hypothetical protein